MTFALRCPSCRVSLRDGAVGESCPSCGFRIAAIDGIPILLRDAGATREVIDEAKRDGRAAWYEAPQAGQWEGPYRHHMLKRRRYVEGVLSSYRRERGEPLAGADIGCGDGIHLGWLAQHLSPLYASDYNATRVMRAARVGAADVLFVADVTDYPALDDSFDVVYCNHVLEHVPDDARALAEIRRILRPGGLAVVGVPNEGAAFWRLAYRLEPETRATTDHVHFYTARSLAARCRAAGLRVREIAPLGWGLPHWSLDSRVRGYKVVDDAFEAVGRRLLPSQATSLYLILEK